MSAAVKGVAISAPGHVLTAPSSSSAVDQVIAWPSAPVKDPSQRVHTANDAYIADYVLLHMRVLAKMYNYIYDIYRHQLTKEGHEDVESWVRMGCK